MKKQRTDEERMLRWKYGRFLRDYVRHRGRRAHISLERFADFLKMIGEKENFDSAENEIRAAENLYK